MLTTAERDAFLAGYDNKWVGLLTAISNFRTGSVTEASHAGYARAQVSLGAAADTSPVGGRVVKNDAAISFGQKTDAGTVDVIGRALYDASTGGSPKGIGLLDADPPIVGAVDDPASGDNIVAKGHGLAANQRVFVLGAPGAEVPAGLSENTAYFVGTVVDTNRFTLSTTTGNGNPVNITGQGAALFIPYTPVTIAQNATPEFAINALALEI